MQSRGSLYVASIIRLGLLSTVPIIFAVTMFPTYVLAAPAILRLIVSAAGDSYGSATLRFRPQPCP